MKKKLFFFGCFLLVVSFRAPLIALAGDEDGGIRPERFQHLINYKVKKFFTSKPPITHNMLKLVKIEKTSGGYYGYYN